MPVSHATRPLALVVLLLVVLSATSARAEGWRSRLTGPKAAARLSASEASDRREAAGTLGRHGAREPAVDALVEALPDERDATVRRAIVRALARRGDPRAVPALVEALQSGAEANRRVVTDALGALGTEAAIVPLVHALEHPEAAGAAGQALLRVGAPAIPHLLRALRNPGTQKRAANVLGELGSPFATAHLVRLLRADEPETRAAAVRALGAIGDDRAADALVDRLDDEVDAVARAALRSLARVGAERHVDAVRAQLDASEPKRRRAALQALVRLAPHRAASILERWAKGEEAQRVRTAAELAIRYPDEALLPLLYGLLREGTRADQAASTLAELQGGAGLPVLIAEANAADDERVTAASRGLAVCLRRWRHRIDPDARRRATAVLRGMSGPRSLLLRALARDPEVGSALIEALGSSEARDRALAGLGLQLLERRRYAARVAQAAARERDAEAFRRLATAAWTLGGRVAPSELHSRMMNVETAPEAMVLAAASSPEASAGARRNLRELLRRRLRAEDPRVRVGAARALARMRDEQAWRGLVTRLEDRAPEVRRAAARALEVLAVPEARDAIAAHWRIEEDGRVRRAMRDAIDAPRRRPLERYEATGQRVLRVRVIATAKRRAVPVDIVLPDGRWLRTRTLSTGELLLPGLPAGDADVRVRIGTES